MQTQLTVLNNGLHVVSKKDETTGMFNIGVWCRCGSRFETPAQNGIAHFCEHMTFKGTTTRSELEINEQIADLGGKSNAWTDMDTTAFSIEVLNEDREAVIELLADILLNSTFTEANIDSERQVIFQEMYEDENENINRILDVVIAEIKKLAAEPVSSRELERAKRQMIVALTKKAEDNEDSIEVSAEQLLNFGRLRSTEEQISRINAVSTDDVLAAAAAIFATTPSYLVQGRIADCYSYEQIKAKLR